MFYTGIGSRETPSKILTLMTKLARYLNDKGYTLRSGGAQGADSAFETGTHKKEIYLPWKGFNGNPSPLHTISDEAFEMAKHFHPAWRMCNQAARKFHARNCYQVLGLDLNTPSEFILCWTLNASGEGGTGQALRIAKYYSIPIYDLADPSAITRFKETT